MVRTASALLLIAAASLQAQPGLGDAAAIRAGAVLYGQRCGACHGADGHGGEAPDLSKSGLVTTGPAKDLFRTIHDGVRGTEMPPFALPDDQIWKIVAWLYSAARPGMGAPVAGDPEAGRQVFEKAGCAGCHMIGGRGGFLGPDLSGIAQSRFAAQIRKAILDPAASVAFGYQPVKVILADHREVRGLLKNEDNFTIQVLKPDGSYALFPRDRIARVLTEPAALMPADFGQKLDAQELQNLLAYLDRQRAPATSAEIRTAY
jgi:putative heme-binding domain-containing protein